MKQDPWKLANSALTWEWTKALIENSANFRSAKIALNKTDDQIRSKKGYIYGA